MHATHTAAAEEVEHARLAFDLAVHFRTEPAMGVQVKLGGFTNKSNDFLKIQTIRCALYRIWEVWAALTILLLGMGVIGPPF